MSNRVTGDEVKEVINTSRTSTQIAPMITAANLLVTAKCSSAGYSDSELKEIERWLSAHFVAGYDRSSSLSSKTVGEASETYATSESSKSFALGSTPYGDRAMMLDYRGCLQSLGRQKVVIRGFGADHEDFA